MLQKSYLPQNVINIMNLSFDVHFIHFSLTCAQKFKYQPSHLNVKQVQNHILKQVTCMGLSQPEFLIYGETTQCRRTLFWMFFISLLQSLWLESYFVGSLNMGVLKPTEGLNNILYI
jgi:hypothetical protein